MIRARDAAATVVLFAVACVAVVTLWHTRGHISDVGTYHRYATALADGRLPYRDFPLEYPPGALVAFAAPLVLPGSYATAFALWTGLCGAAAILAMAVVLRRLGGSRTALLLPALSPVLLGPVVLERYDLWPAALAVAGVAAAVCGRARLAAAALGAGFAAKYWPGLVAPVLLAHAWRAEGRRRALEAAGVFAAVVAAAFVPFLVLARAGLDNSIAGQLHRPLQVESLGASLLIAAHHLFGLALHPCVASGSDNLCGSTAVATARVTTAVQVLVILAVLAAVVRGVCGSEPLAAVAAVVAAFVAFGKVFSPQFLLWLVPLVPLVRSRAATLLLAAALLLTQAWFPSRYYPLARHFAQPESWLLLARDLSVVAVVVTVSLPLLPRWAGRRGGGRSRARPPSPT